MRRRLFVAVIRDDPLGDVRRHFLVVVERRRERAAAGRQRPQLRGVAEELGLGDVGGAVLVVSQFTLYGDCRKGRRPSFVDAAPPEIAVPLYEAFVNAIKANGIPTATGRFGAMMQVELVNDGPVTLIVDSK